MDAQVHIDIGSHVLDKGLKEATNLCAHREPLDGRRLNCEIMPEWAVDEYTKRLEEELINSVNDEKFRFPDELPMDRWIWDNSTLRKIYVARGAGRQMVYNMTHALALEEHFALDPQIMTEVNQIMREDFPEEIEVDDDDEKQKVC